MLRRIMFSSFDELNNRRGKGDGSGSALRAYGTTIIHIGSQRGEEYRQHFSIK